MDPQQPRDIRAPWAQYASVSSASGETGSGLKSLGGGPLVLLALAAGAAVAFAGGLGWAGVVLATHYDIGFLAWFIGVATGWTIVRLAGGPVGGLACFTSGLLAAGGILVGKYVVFIHEVKRVLGTELAQHGVTVGYLNTHMMSVFFHHFSTFVRPIYGLWVILAFVAGFMTAAGGRTLPGQRRRGSARA